MSVQDGDEIIKHIRKEIEENTEGCFYDGKGYNATDVLSNFLKGKVVVDRKWLEERLANPFGMRKYDAVSSFIEELLGKDGGSEKE